ncbi:MAG: hypothetical protein LBL75_02640 [Rickettsiales bacterium]|nr:hypothetical protein [Rickettsiales bacterium]
MKNIRFFGALFAIIFTGFSAFAADTKVAAKIAGAGQLLNGWTSGSVILAGDSSYSNSMQWI